ncbi:MAG: DUF512 domain-containing protein [Desulfuromonadales bacterium]
MVEIIGVDEGSIAEELELEVGDVLLSMNGQPVRDLLDYQIYVATEELLLEVRKKNGELWDLEFEKDLEDGLGIHLEHPAPVQCGNNCIFCFVHQLPPKMRPTLYVKDEDYRFSYLYGSYVTLTNIEESEIQRILDQHLSPLYVSVHATEEDLRTRMIGRQGPAILPLLKRLCDGGIELHTQIVVCPGYNDGEELDRTITDLYALRPGVLSLAVVPVGLTGYRERLPDLRPPTQQEATDLLNRVHNFQQKFLEQGGSRFVYAADEFYLKAGLNFPALEDYEELAQLENGVGLIPLFRLEAADVLAEAGPLGSGTVSVITGESALLEIEIFAQALARRTGITIQVFAIRNDFFGGQVTVTGLLTGRDVVSQLTGKPLGRCLIVPDVVLKEGEDVFLDDFSLTQLAESLGVSVCRVPTSPWGLLEALESLPSNH